MIGHCIVKFLKNKEIPLLIYIVYGGLGRCLSASKMIYVAGYTSQIIGCIPYGVGMSRVAIEHTDQVCPAINSLVVFISIILLYNIAKQTSGH
jgi:hypothetical protein